MSPCPAHCSQRVFPSRSAPWRTHLGADHQLWDAVHHGHGGRGQWHLLLPILALQPAEAKGLLSAPHTESTVSGICAGCAAAAACAESQAVEKCWKQTGKTGEKSQMLSCSKLSLTTNGRPHRNCPSNVTTQNSAQGSAHIPSGGHLLRVGCWPRVTQGTGADTYVQAGVRTRVRWAEREIHLSLPALSSPRWGERQAEVSACRS